MTTTNRIARPAIAAALALLVLAQARDAAAQRTVTSRQYDGFNKIDKGVAEIGLDNLWIFNWASQEDDTSLRMTVLSGLSGRYFLRPNLAIGLTGSGLYKSVGSEDRDLGGVIAASAGYYLRLGNGMFLAPTVGGGALFGQRRTPIAPGMTQESALAGGVVTLGFPLVFYSWERFNIRAGLSFLFSFGNATAPDDTTTSFANLDGGFSAGFAYYF